MAERIEGEVPTARPRRKTPARARARSGRTSAPPECTTTAATAEAERYATELLARETTGRSPRIDQLVDVLFQARARERFRRRFERPLDPAEQAKLSEAQAEVIVAVIESFLNGLGLSAEQLERGRELVAAGLRAADPPPGPVEFVASLSATERTILRETIDAERARREADRSTDGAAASRHDDGMVSVHQPARPHQS